MPHKLKAVEVAEEVVVMEVDVEEEEVEEEVDTVEVEEVDPMTEEAAEVVDMAVKVPGSMIKNIYIYF
jgi:hypothetical protein